jgi:dipeptidyl aminopeptidase/acylaminoacyl peptidase
VDADDVLAVADAAVERFGLDASRIGILGGSYGGYMTSWLIGHTDRFAAACSERSVNNQLTMVSTSDIGTSFQRAYAGVSHLDDPGEYLRMSPITYVQAMTTPLLILHSDGDLRCPVSQAEELWTALRLVGREVELVRFPGSGHELSRSGPPKQRVWRAEVILEWFGRHLGASTAG